MEFLRSFLRRHLARKPVVASPNVGCFLRLHGKLTRRFPWISCTTTHRKILNAFPKTSPLKLSTEMKPTKCPAKEKKMRPEKGKKRGGEKAKRKSQDWLLHLQHFKPKNFLRTPKLRKLIYASGWEGREVDACKRLCGKFYPFIAREWPGNGLTSFNTRFAAKFSGANG